MNVIFLNLSSKTIRGVPEAFSGPGDFLETINARATKTPVADMAAFAHEWGEAIIIAELQEQTPFTPKTVGIIRDLHREGIKQPIIALGNFDDSNLRRVIEAGALPGPRLLKPHENGSWHIDGDLLRAHVKALSNFQIRQPEAIFKFMGFEIDSEKANKISFMGHPLDLADTTRDVFDMIIRNKGRAVDHETVRARVWESDGTQIDDHYGYMASNIRKAMSPILTKMGVPDDWDILRTVKGVGYSLNTTTLQMMTSSAAAASNLAANGDIYYGGFYRREKGGDIFLLGKHLALSPRENAIVQTMLNKKGGVVSRDEIFAACEENGVPIASSRPGAVRDHINNLRDKIALHVEDAGHNPAGPIIAADGKLGWSLTKHAQPFSDRDVTQQFAACGFEVNQRTGTATFRGEDLKLTFLQKKLLSVILDQHNKGALASHESLLASINRMERKNDRAFIARYVTELHQDLNGNMQRLGYEPAPLIKGQWGKGWRLLEENILKLRKTDRPGNEPPAIVEDPTPVGPVAIPFTPPHHTDGNIPFFGPHIPDWHKRQFDLKPRDRRDLN